MAESQNTSIKMSFYHELVANNHLSDIKIRVGPDKSSAWIFPAHQFLLRASSPVFTAMLSGEYAETKQDEIRIEDILPHTFYKVLLYIYKGDLQVQSISETFSIYLAADKYQMDSLTNACAVKLEKFPINWEMFWDLLSDCFGSLTNVAPFQLKLNLLLFLDENAHTVLTDNKFLFLSREVIMMIISRNTLQVNELIVCESLINWSKMQCLKKEVEPSAENQRKGLGDAFYKLKLSLINKKDLFSSPIYDILTEEEKTDICQTSATYSFFSELSLVPRDVKQRELLQRGERKISNFKGPVYFIFAKDAFVHDMRIELSSCIKEVRLSALNQRGKEMLVKTVYGAEFNSVYVKAFVCYKLVFEFSQYRSEKCWSYGSLGCENGAENAVFFSLEDQHIVDYSQFLSTEYWKKTFVSQMFVPDDQGTCICKIKATFC